MKAEYFCDRRGKVNRIFSVISSLALCFSFLFSAFTQITGNFYSTQGVEPVLGFFSGTTVQEKRIFIDSRKLPLYLQTYRTGCTMDTIPADKIFQYGSSTLLIDSYGYPVLGYFTSASRCIDCRIEGGVTVKPSFWE